ncbi:MAG: transposase [Myxococcota bacterium]
MKNRAEEFRKAAAEPSPGRYADRLRKMALEHLASVRAQGRPLSQAAGELDIDPNTLRDWKRRAKPSAPASGGMLPVEVREPLSACETRYVVVSNGVRVECASPESVARLLAVLP